jgi:hypothetical protein
VFRVAEAAGGALEFEPALAAFVVGFGAGAAPVVAHVDVALPLVPDVIGRRAGEAVRAARYEGVVGGMLRVEWDRLIEVCRAWPVDGDPGEGLLEAMGNAGDETVGGAGPSLIRRGEQLGAGVEGVVGVEDWLDVTKGVVACGGDVMGLEDVLGAADVEAGLARTDEVCEFLEGGAVFELDGLAEYLEEAIIERHLMG